VFRAILILAGYALYSVPLYFLLCALKHQGKYQTDSMGALFAFFTKNEFIVIKKIRKLIEREVEALGERKPQPRQPLVHSI